MNKGGAVDRCRAPDASKETYQVNIETQLEYSVNVGEVVEHDLSVDAGEEPSQHTRSQEHERRIQTDDSE